MSSTKIKSWFILLKATLLMILTLPVIILGFKGLSERGIQKALSILHELVDLGVMTQEEYDEAFEEGREWKK